MDAPEVWKVVPSNPHLSASSWGRVRVGNGGPRIGTWDAQRKRYTLPVRGMRRYKVARLVCEAFHGSPPPRAVCMHLDENARNNRPENLAWGTQKENLNAPGFLAYCRSRTGENNPYNKGRKAQAIPTSDRSDK